MTGPTAPVVGIIMGSQSDWPTLRHAAETLDRLAVPHETRIVSAHRTPDRLREYASTAQQRGLRGDHRRRRRGGAPARHVCRLDGRCRCSACRSNRMHCSGMDSLLSIVQMPAGVPVGTLAIGRAGAVNAGLLAAAILALGDPALAARLAALRAEQTASVATEPHDPA